MTNDQPSLALSPVQAAAQRRIDFARAQRDRVIASLLRCPARDQQS